MVSKKYPVLYDRQFEKYIGQFMRALGGFQVEDGVERNGSKNTRKVGVVYGAMDRVVASYLSSRNDHLVNSRLPVIGVNMSAITPTTDDRMSPYWNEPIAYTNDQDKQVSLHRTLGQGFSLSLEATLYASSTSELFMLLEQLLLVFNPRLVIQSGTDIANSDYITSVSLESIQPELIYPLGQGTQECAITLGFTIPVRLRYPLDRNKTVVERIIANVMEGDKEDNQKIFEEIIDGE